MPIYDLINMPILLYDIGQCTTLTHLSTYPFHSGTTSVCGGVGYCNTDTGTCFNCGGNWDYHTLYIGTFYGNGCQYFSCYGTLSSEGNTPELGLYGNLCSGNGACLSMRELANYAYTPHKELAVVSYTAPWDAGNFF